MAVDPTLILSGVGVLISALAATAAISAQRKAQETADAHRKLEAAVLELQLASPAREQDERRRTVISLLVTIIPLLEDIAARFPSLANLRGAAVWSEQSEAELRRVAAGLDDADAALSEAAVNMCTELAWIRPMIIALQAAPRGASRLDAAEFRHHLTRALDLANAAQAAKRT